jgi:hypothetical protein
MIRFRAPLFGKALQERRAAMVAAMARSYTDLMREIQAETGRALRRMGAARGRRRPGPADRGLRHDGC